MVHPSQYLHQLWKLLFFLCIGTIVKNATINSFQK